MYQILLLLTASLFFQPTVLADTKSVQDPCNFEVITDSCRIFDPEGPERMTLTDGRIMFNFVAAIQNENDKYFRAALERKIANEEKSSPQFLRVRQKLVELLNEVSSEKMDPRFKFYVVNNFVEFIELLFDQSRLVKKQIEIPWPPEKPEKDKMVSQQEVIARLSFILKREQFVRIQSIYDEMKTLQLVAQKFSALNSNDEIIKNLPVGRQQLVSKYFEFARNRIISIISNGNPENKLTDSEQTLIRRVRSVKLIQFDSESEAANKSCVGGIPNAFYDARNNSVTLCPFTFLLSDGAIIQIVAHEIAHSIAPCTSQFGTFEIASDKLVKAASGVVSATSREISKDPSKQKMLLELLAINKKSNITAYPFPLISGEESVKYFVNKEIIKPEIPGVKAEQYPFRSVTQCLVSRHGFRGVEAKEIKRIATEATQARIEFREPSYDPKADERQIIDAFSKYPGCLNPEKEIQLDEAMSDWFSSKVLADYLSGNPLKTNEERLGMVSYLAGLVCKQRYEGQRQVKRSSASVFIEAVKDSEMLSESHPPSKRRIERIIFGEPQIRKAAGCSFRPELACQR